MMSSLSRLLIVTTFAACGLTMADPGGVALKDYPEMDDVQWGHLRHIARMAGQLDGDWNGMGTKEPDQEGDDGYRYQLAGAASALALAHYHRLPAYREFFQETSEQLIRKMLRREVWGYWENSSRGSKKLNPDLKQLGEGWIDPVKNQNIMYSAYLLQMVGMYHALFADDRYDQPGSLTFDFSPVWRGIELDAQKFIYDAPKLAEVVMRCVTSGSGLGCECEPNAVFVLCNQPAILGLRFFDQTHGTQHAETTINRYRAGWDAIGGWVHPSGSFVAFRTTAQQKIDPLEAPNIDGFTGAWMNAWNRDQVRDLYERQRDRWIKWLPDDTAYVTLGDEVDFLATNDYGAMLIYVSEIGDQKTLDGLLAYADKRLHPTWEDGALFYPRQDRVEGDDGLPIFMNRFTGNSLIAYARLNVPDGMWKLYHEPFDEAHFSEPSISGIEFPAVCVTRAIFDRKKQTLIVSLKPGLGNRKQTSFHIDHLNFQKSYDIQDGLGRSLARVEKGVIVPADPAGAAQFEIAGKALKVSLPLDGPADFMVRTALKD